MADPSLVSPYAPVQDNPSSSELSGLKPDLARRKLSAMNMLDTAKAADNSWFRAGLDAVAAAGAAAMQERFGIPAGLFKPANTAINQQIAPIDKNTDTSAKQGLVTDAATLAKNLVTKDKDKGSGTDASSSMPATGAQVNV
jgi:hypothetical protein